MKSSRLTALAALVSIAAATSALSVGCTGDPDESEDTGEVAQELQVCAAGETVEGIDVSVWQADVDWQAVKADGIAYAFARASYGTSKDTYFDQNWAGMKGAGLIRGAYQYWLPSKDPIAQADAMLAIMGPLEATDLPPVVDVEQTDGVSKATLVERLGQWLKHVESAIGRKPIIYSGKYFWQDNVQSDAFLDYPLWIPNYSLDCPDLPNGYWPDWKFFQYTSTGHVNGVSGNVDRNLFNGSLQDLLAFAGNGGAKYGAEFVSQSFPYASEPPVAMVAGQKVTLSIEMKNTGSEPWNESTRLATTEPRDRESPFAGAEWPGANRYAQVQGVVMPGETYKFTWTMHAPKETGLYDEHFGLVQEGVTWFGDPGQGGPPDAQLEGLFQVGESKFDGDGVVEVPFGEGDETGSGSGEGKLEGDAKMPGNCSVAMVGATVGATAGATVGATVGATAGATADPIASVTPGTASLFAAALALSGLARRRRRS